MPDLKLCPYCSVLLTTPTALCPSCHRAVKPNFPRVRLLEGYDMKDVDAFVEKLNERLFITPTDQLVDEINQVRFTPVRIKAGYEMQAVDRWLDELIAVVKTRQGQP